MAAYGYNCGGDANGMAGEWELCSKKDFKTHPMAENLYKLVTGKSPSSDEYGYKLPYGLPDGNYQVVEVGDCSPRLDSIPALFSLLTLSCHLWIFW